MKRLAVIMAFVMTAGVCFANSAIKSDESIVINIGDVSDYVGEFQFNESSPIKNLKIEKSGEVLIGKTETGQSELVAKEKKDTFSLKDYEATLEFKRDGSGAVTGVVLTVQGGTFEGVKK